VSSEAGVLRASGLEGLIYKGFALTGRGRSEIIQGLDIFHRHCREIVRDLRLVLCLVLACLSSQLALAAGLRPFPVAAKKVEMTFVAVGQVSVDGKAFLLSPGAQIRDTNNRIVLPSYVNGEHMVRVLIDNIGQVHRVWILTPEEIAAPDPKQ
tara:strand:- start:204608 stop:205066 length:459 start_codon:yes stop_codon:yes gene_type:complete